MTDSTGYKKTASGRKRAVHALMLLFSAAAAGAAMIPGSLRVYAETSVGTTQHVETGAVEIELREKTGGNDGGKGDNAGRPFHLRAAGRGYPGDDGDGCSHQFPAA